MFSVIKRTYSLNCVFYSMKNTLIHVMFLPIYIHITLLTTMLVENDVRTVSYSMFSQKRYKKVFFTRLYLPSYTKFYVFRLGRKYVKLKQTNKKSTKGLESRKMLLENENTRHILYFTMLVKSVTQIHIWRGVYKIY